MLDSLDVTLDIALRAAPFTASVTFLEDASTADPGVVAVTVTRENGETLTTGNAAGTGAGARSFLLSASNTADLDVLKLEWVSSTKGTIVSYVEIVGGFVCALGQIDDSLNRGGSSSDYSLELKGRVRAAATRAFEEKAGTAFTPRYTRAVMHGPGCRELCLPTPRVRSVTSVVINGTALSSDELDELIVDEVRGVVYNPAGWQSGVYNLEVTWEHGWPFPPADVSRAVALIASSMLADGPFDDRGYGVTDDAGFVRLLTAGVAGASFSIPEVQAALARYRHPTVA